MPLKVQPGPLGSVSTVRVSVANLPRSQWQLHHHPELSVLFCCVLGGEPTDLGAVGPAHLVEVVPNPWKTVLSAVDVESGAVKPHHASKQTELGGREGEVGEWASCSAIWWGTASVTFQEKN